MNKIEIGKLSPYLASFVSGALIVVFITLAVVFFTTTKQQAAPTSSSVELVVPEPAPTPEPTAPEERPVTEVTVNWHDHYVDVDEYEFIGKLPVAIHYSQLYPVQGTYDEVVELGVIESGELAGAKVYDYIGYSEEELGGSYAESKLLISTKNAWGFENFFVQKDIYGGEQADEFYAVGSSDQKTILRITNFLNTTSTPLPTTLSLPSGKKLIGGYPSGRKVCHACVFGGEEKIYEKAFLSREGIQLYTTKEHRIFEGGEEGKPHPDIYIAFNSLGRSYDYSSHIPVDDNEIISTDEITWETNFKNDSSYKVSRTERGCGGYGPYKTYTPTELGTLQKIGSTQNDGDVYLPINFETSTLTKEAYDMWYTFDSDGEKPDYQAFLKEFKVPYFLWQDAFGRWLKYESDTLVPAAECGKPVIYLYPEKETDIHIELPHFIKVTVSEPKYPYNGWDVTAKPNGELTMQDGSKYGSLFWEGTGVGYKTPETGFVVARENIPNFLYKTLPKYGLNETEIAEFMEFWVPELNKSKFYRLSCLTDEFDKAAPLNVIPKPNTIIRLFMDVKPLSAPMEIDTPIIHTPQRLGFTLVEWGGLLYR